MIRFGFRQCCSYKSYHNGIVHFLSSKQTYFFKKVCNKLVLCVFYMNVHVCHCAKYKASVHSREQVCHNLKIVWSLTLVICVCSYFQCEFLVFDVKNTCFVILPEMISFWNFSVTNVEKVGGLQIEIKHGSLKITLEHKSRLVNVLRNETNKYHFLFLSVTVINLT